ncbi:MAG: hypothetical protein JOZ73_08810 [Solirubrobacterales bacterium]|nr:hypothetical protein [Solirubrobacterales bacterium]
MLIVILVIGSALGSKSSTVSAVNPGMRAVIVPTADGSRTVVVPPCGTGTNVTSTNAALTSSTPGAITLQLPQGPGDRIVLIPKCTGARGGVSGTSAVPSAAFVTKAGTAIPPVGPSRSTASSSSQAGAPGSAQLQVSVPDGSPIRTVVVAPCEKVHDTGPAEQILGTTGRSSTAIAPSC